MVVEVAESMVNEQSSPTPPRVTPVRRVKLNRAQLDSTTTYMLQNCLNSSKLTPPEQSSSRWANISKARCRACFRSSVGYLWHSTRMDTMWVCCAFAKFISQDMRNAGCFAPVHQAEPPASVRGLLLLVYPSAACVHLVYESTVVSSSTHTHAAHRSSTKRRISFSSKTD